MVTAESNLQFENRNPQNKPTSFILHSVPNGQCQYLSASRFIYNSIFCSVSAVLAKFCINNMVDILQQCIE